MALRQHHAVATVVSTQVISHDEATILVEAGGFDPTSWFLNRAQTEREEEDDDGPPKKRRKSTPSGHNSCHVYDPSPDSKEHILLARSAIDLYFPETLSSQPLRANTINAGANFENSPSVPVIPNVVDRFDEGTRLKLALPRLKGAVLVLNTVGVDQAALDAFRSMCISEMGKKVATMQSQDPPKPSNHSATWSQCTIARSQGPHTVVRLESSLYWRSGSSAFPQGVPTGKARIYSDYEILSRCFADHGRETERSEPFKPQDFYDSVHVPNRDIDTRQHFEGVLESELYPFQKRAVHWLLYREGAKYKHDDPQPISSSPRDEDVGFVSAGQDFNGEQCYVNHLQGIIQRDAATNTRKFSGGVLAEEMGLGKTVELMALITLHQRPGPLREKRYDHEYDMELRPSKATLIITPSSILDQWKSELARHAPGLKVFHYGGISVQSKKNEEHLVEELTTKYDVVLATYQTLAKEIHFAEDPPDRAMRHKRKFERKRSPLVKIDWWRICLDEAQMVESGVTAAARVARRLPRVHSWAVSGTPLRKNVQDLHGLLIFLRYKPLCDDARLWSHLITNHKHLFHKIFRKIALRHTKAQIREELDLPPQKRVVVSVPFSAIEQQQYATLFSQMCKDIGVTNVGAPKHDDWDPQDAMTVEQMRSWLVRLRQTCLHPQVGGKNRKALGRGANPLRTVGEVLEVMIDNNEAALRTEERGLLATQLVRAHVLGNAADDDHRSEKALKIYLAAMEDSDAIVKDARRKLASAKQAQIEKGEDVVETDDEDSSSESTPLLGRLRNSLRTGMQLQHECIFFAATAYYNIKSNKNLTAPGSDRFRELEEHEVGLYERAKLVRREILKDSARKSESMMKRIKDTRAKDGFTKMPKLSDLEGFGGIENQRIVEKSDMLFDVLREQTNVISQWRTKMAEYLLKPLVDEDEGIETTGEEYEDSTKLQDELYPYFDAVKAMQADMNTYVTGVSAPLIDHEVKVVIRAAKTFLDKDIVDDMKGHVHAPELTLELLAIRNKLRTKKDAIGSVRDLIQEARALETSLGFGSRAAERSFVHKHLASLQAVFSAYTKALAGLEKEVDLFRQAQNQRLEFYRQLQELSDSVKPYKEELDPRLDLATLEVVMAREDRETHTLGQHRTTNRFLLHLREDSSQNDPKICVVCQCPFDVGVLTVCGHQYCKECIGHWWQTHRTCPLCKRKLATVDFHDITYKPQQLRAQEEQSGPSSPSDAQSSVSSRQSSIYSDVDGRLMDDIKAIDLPSSYGTKIDTIGRHLLWIREHDPGAKSIVFSQFREFLDVLGMALADFKIGHARLGRTNAAEKFKRDASVDCLLLDAKTDSSGLTLVNATHVFICEPLIQTAVELQAIARVHRIGQTRPTTVWMYLVNDTVEEAIYEISVARRLAHVQSRQQQQQQSKKFQKSRSATPAPVSGLLDMAESEELQSAPLSKLLVAGKGGGEVVGSEDLWRCLFGKAQKAAPSVEAERVAGRHLRAEAAEGRRQDGDGDSGAGASRHG